MIKKLDTTFLSAVEVYKLVLDGKLKKFPLHFWEKSDSMLSAKKILLWLFEENLKLKDEDIKKKISVKFFKENKLMGMLNALFNASPFKAIDLVYPNKFNPWELHITTMNYWNIETGIKATKWLIEEKLCFNDMQIKDKLTVKLFKDNNLGGMLQTVFGDSPYNAINTVYPNKFKPWEISMTHTKYWNVETGIQSVKWLIEDRFKYTEEQIKKKISKKLFFDNHLGGMLQIVFGDSPYNAINATYPNKFKPWEFKTCPQNYWNTETAQQSIKWLIEEKLKYDEKQIRENASVKLFKDNNLGGMLQKVFGNSPYNAINATYPNLLTK